ncbi:MAG: RtcB family protein [Akkermansiaceae bacterium]|jgi:tRNA-splicing ligase RtcB (3'-phosphate/5'-hydroxy nucleic acid ligase)|nr:RtcB family protein [Akkermansiaceae bacterium]MDP4648039.1 RtcB family protein [Akkermansiaceae bacterium]MDP4781387.1 RtcB family protein [Akkermansiaceae bacterium]MDP4897636.1 RtcB family protein [Akkermansiaceae bacterium]MDP4995306.1 RtcB family protein [Akkermansiaceae bacterium]
MKLLTSQDLIDAGYEPGPVFKTLFAKISELEEKGITDPKYAMKLLKRDCGKPVTKLKRHTEPIPFSEAITPANAEEEKNVEKVRKQMHALLRTPILRAGVILPDACPVSPQEAVIPVGAAVVAENAIIPSAHSADICCSMYATFYESNGAVAGELDALTSVTNFGSIPRKEEDAVYDQVLDEEVWENPFLKGLQNRARMHMADQGDGNHFAYIGEMEVTPEFLAVLRLTGYADLAANFASHVSKKLRVLVTHHGSRSIGAHLYKRGQNAAEKHTAKVAEGIPKASAWLDATSDTGKDYWDALQYIARWTKANHRAIHRRFLEKISGSAIAEFGNEHNFVWKRGEHFYHGKGATPAWKDEAGRPKLGLIPLNMAEPILLALGADNEDFLSFAPHGAGRNMSRTALMRKFPEEKDRERQLVESTSGIDARWFSGVPDLSETPVAYKNAAEVKKQIADFGLAEVIAEIKPLGCIMAGHIDQPWRSRKDKLSPKQLRQIEHRAERRTVRQHLTE